MHCHPPRIRILFRSRIIIDYEPTCQSKHFLSFSRKLFLSVISLFLVFAICFIAYQYQREREYKVELLNTQLQDYNSRLYEQLNDSPAIEETTDKYIRDHALKDLRVTLIDLQGNVIYDSYKTQEIKHENHRDRPEVQRALKEGNGFDVRRTSETTGLPYFTPPHVTGIILSGRRCRIMSA